MMRVLLVDDVPERSAELCDMLSKVQGLSILGQVKTSADVRSLRGRGTADVVVISLAMARGDAFSIAKDTMVAMPTPIVMISEGTAPPSESTVQTAIAAGALTVLPRPIPPGVGASDERACSIFVSALRAFAQVKVVGHRLAARPSTATPTTPGERLTTVPLQVIAIGASTGGPTVLRTVLAKLPASYPLPVLVVQHLVHGFAGEFVRWLDEHVPMRVKTAVVGERIAPGTVYVAPEDKHLKVRRGREIVLSDEPLVEGFRPSASVLFESVASVYGPSTLALVLSGMGRDGVAGLHHVRNANGRIAVQDEASSVVFGMPGAAIEAGLADQVLSVPGLSSLLAEIARNRP